MSAFTDSLALLLEAEVPRAFPLNGVPDDPEDRGYPYTVYSVTGDQAGGYTLDSRHGFRGYRIVLQSFDRDLIGALDFDEAATDLLLDQRLTVDGYDCTPCRVELGSAVTRDPDDSGVVGVTTTLTFNATKET